MKLKRIMTAAMAGVITAVCAAGNVSAATETQTPPSSYDINGDGDISISDVVALSMFLSGITTANNVSVFDANQNGIIDELDKKSIMAYLGMVGVPKITMI